MPARNSNHKIRSSNCGQLGDVYVAFTTGSIQPTSLRFHNAYSSPDTDRSKKLRMMRWTGHIGNKVVNTHRVW